MTTAAPTIFDDPNIFPTAQVVSGRTIIVKDSADNATTFNITLDTEGAETNDVAPTMMAYVDRHCVELYCRGTTTPVVRNYVSTAYAVATP